MFQKWIMFTKEYEGLIPEIKYKIHSETSLEWVTVNNVHVSKSSDFIEIGEIERPEGG